MKLIKLKRTFSSLLGREIDMGKWRMKKRMIVFCMLLYSLVWGLSFQCKAAEPVDGELIILIDTSKSIEGAWEEIKQWATKIGVCIQDTGIVVSVRGFGGRDELMQEVYNGEVKSGDNALENGLQEYFNRIQKLNADKQYTDQTGAIQSAIQSLEASSAQKKCIILLSDGYLDYKKKEGEDTIAVQNKAKEDFKTLVESFAAKENHNILLVQFESSYKDGVYIFSNLEGVELLPSDENQEKFMDQEELLDKAIQLGFEDLGIGFNRNELTIHDYKAEFSLEKAYCRTIIEIELQDNDVTKEVLGAVQIVRKDDNKEMKPVLLDRMGKLGFIYLENTREGFYIVNLPKGNWKCNIITMEDMEIQSIRLFVVLEEGMDVQCIDDVYLLNKDEKYKLRIEVQTQAIEQYSSLDKAEIDCFLISEDGEKKAVGIVDRVQDGIYQSTLDFGKDTSYTCYVEIQYAGELLIRSEEIKIAINEDPTSSECDKIDSIPKNLDIYEIFNISKESEINTQNYELKVNNKDIASEGERETSEYQYKDFCLTFKKAGKYDVCVDIKDDGNEKKVRYQCDVADDRNCFQKFWDWLLGK